VIGSRRKVRRIFDALLDGGLPEAALARISAPVGLDVGSESVDEIDVSIVAELIARRNLGPAALRRPKLPRSAGPIPGERARLPEPASSR